MNGCEHDEHPFGCTQVTLPGGDMETTLGALLEQARGLGLGVTTKALGGTEVVVELTRSRDVVATGIGATRKDALLQALRVVLPVAE